MAEIDDELKRILQGAGEDIKKIREHLTGASRALVKNTQSKLAEQKVVKELIKQNEKLRESLKENNLLTKERSKTIDNNIEVIKEHSKATKSATKGWFSWKGALMGVIKWLGRVAVAALETGVEFAKTSSNIKTFGDLVAAGAEDIPGLGRILKVFGKELDDRTQMFKGLAQSGATFGSSITSLADAAYTAGMPLVQFQELIQNNTSTMARLFGSVNEGIPQIAGLGRALKKFTMDELSGFGITMDETNQFMTTYAEIERARGRAGQLTAKTLLEGTKAYAKNLTTLSRLTGESVDAIDKRNRGIAADGVFQAKLAQMSEEQQQRVYAAMALLPESAQQAAKELIGMRVPIGDAAKGLEVFSGGHFSRVLLGFTDATGKFTNNDLLKLANEFKILGTVGTRTGDAMASAAMVGNQIAGAAAHAFSDMAGTVADEEKFNKQTMSSMIGHTKHLVSIDDQLGLVTAELQAVNTHLLAGLIINADSKFGGILEKFTDGNVEWSKGLKETLIKVTDMALKPKKDKEYTSSRMSNLAVSYAGYSSLGAETEAMPARGSKEWLEMYKESYAKKNRQLGTYGTTGKMFENFGSGTPVDLHGSEAVVPENTLFGQALSILEGLKNKTEAVGTSPEKKEFDRVGVGISQDTATLTEIKNILQSDADTNDKTLAHLNTLVTIGAMTEKNTKSTHKGLAELSGTLV